MNHYSAITSGKYLDEFADDRLPPAVAEEIGRLCITGDSAVCGLIRAGQDRLLADATVIAAASSKDDAYRLYSIYHEWCVEYRPGSTGDLPPCEKYTRPHYGRSDWHSRDLTAAEIAAIYRRSLRYR